MARGAHRAPRRPVVCLVLGLTLSLGLACSPEHSEAAPVTTVAIAFPGQSDVGLSVALTVAADDEGRGRVLFGDGAAAIGWYRIDERAGELRFVTHDQLVALATHEQPTLTGLAVVEAMAVAQGLVRIAADEGGHDRVVRFRVADFSRPSVAELDMIVYPWVAEPGPTLTGPLAAVQLDEGLPEALSGSEQGLVIWDSLGVRGSEYAGARELLLAGDADVFDADPRQGYGLTLCPDLHPTAIAGGRLLAVTGCPRCRRGCSRATSPGASAARLHTSSSAAMHPT